MSRFALVLTLSLLAAAGCGAAGTVHYELGHLDLRVVAAEGSGVSQDGLQTTLVQHGNTWDVAVTSTDSGSPNSALLEVRFSDRYIVDSAVQTAPPGELSLLVTHRPGLAAFGLQMPEGQSVPAGELLRLTLRPATSSERAASKAPLGDFGKVDDFSLTEDAGVVTAHWSYYSRGDYDQNSEVNISDLTPLGMRMGATTSDGDLDEYDMVLDGDGNGEINVSDLTPIGQNYHAKVTDYEVMHADGPDLGSAVTAIAGTVNFSASDMQPQTLRKFTAAIDPLAVVDGHYYYVVPQDSADASKGAASNTVLYAAPVQLKFEVPPPGEQQVDSDISANPSLVLMPAIPGVSMAGAPVITYTTVGGSGSSLKIAYYNSGSWHSEQLQSGNYSNAMAVWREDNGSGTPGPSVVANDLTGFKLVHLTLDEQWQVLGGADVGSGGGAVLLSAAMDLDPATGNLGVVHSYTGASGVDVHFSELAGGIWGQVPVQIGTGAGEIGLDCDFRYDPNGGDAWVLFTHGTVNTSGTLQLDLKLTQGRLAGGIWTTSDVVHPDSPVFVDLGFDGSGAPQLAMTAARDLTVPLVDPPVTFSGYFDVAVGTYSGSWTFVTPFESSLDIGLGGGFPPTTLELTLDLATDVEWSRPSELVYSGASGGIDLDIDTQTPTGGGLDTGVQYMVDGGSGYTDSALFNGSPSRDFSWQEHNGALRAAYLRTGQLAAEDVLGGNLNLGGDLAYWGQP